MHKKLAVSVLITNLLLSSMFLFAVPVVGEEQGLGQVAVGIQAPTLTSRSIADWKSSGAGGSNKTVDSALTVNTYYAFNVTVSCASTMASITNLTIWVYDGSGTINVFNKQHSYGFRYKNQSGVATWYELTGNDVWTSSETYISNASCIVPTLTESSGEWVFKVKYAKVADHTADTSEWHYKAQVYNSGGSSALGEDEDWFEFSYYREFTMAGATVNWGTLNPGDINQTATTPASGDNYVNIVAINHASKIQWHGDADLVRTGGSGTEFPLENVYLGQTNDYNNNDGIKLTTEYQTLWDAIAAGTESTQKAAYHFITVPNPCIDGTYTYNWYAEIIST